MYRGFPSPVGKALGWQTGRFLLSVPSVSGFSPMQIGARCRAYFVRARLVLALRKIVGSSRSAKLTTASTKSRSPLSSRANLVKALALSRVFNSASSVRRALQSLSSTGLLGGARRPRSIPARCDWSSLASSASAFCDCRLSARMATRSCPKRCSGVMHAIARWNPKKPLEHFFLSFGSGQFCANIR